MSGGSGKARPTPAHLGDDCQLAAKGIEPDAAGVSAVQQDAAGGDVDQAEQREHERGLAAARPAHHAAARARLGSESHTVSTNSLLPETNTCQGGEGDLLKHKTYTEQPQNAGQMRARTSFKTDDCLASCP